MKPFLLLLVAAGLQARAASYLGPEIGQEAPMVKVEKWLQPAANASQDWPTGKVVVLEFWATWCRPCVGAIPHLNELAEQFKEQPVQFIAVTDEAENTVSSFLKKTPIKAWVGLTTDKIFCEANPYRVYAIPHTVIVDRRGFIAAVMEPQALTAGLIKLCLANQPLPSPGELGIAGANIGTSELSDPGVCPVPGVVPGQSVIGRTPMFQVMIRPYSSPKINTRSKSSSQAQTVTVTRHWSRSEIALSMPGGLLNDAIQSVFNIDRTRMVLEAQLPNEAYDFYISLPPSNLEHGDHMLETVFSQAVLATFGLTIKREIREVDVLMLRTNVATLAKLATSTSGGKEELYGWGEITGVNRSLESLAGGLEHASGQPVLDETGTTNLYSFNLKWDQKDAKHPNPKGMTTSVNELGLELVPEKRSLEFVVVRAEVK